MGTAAYMSPEQARGQPANKRADIWAYGCVLDEMLAGRRAFDGATWSDTVAKVIEREPDWDALPANLPGAIRTLVRRCLQKNPTDRRQDLADVPFEIADALSTAHRPPDVRVRPKRWPIAIAGATAAAALAVWAAWTVNGDRSGGDRLLASVEFGVTFPDNYVPSAGIAVSPNGRYIAAGVVQHRRQSLASHAGVVRYATTGGRRGRRAVLVSRFQNARVLSRRRAFQDDAS